MSDLATVAIAAALAPHFVATRLTPRERRSRLEWAWMFAQERHRSRTSKGSAGSQMRVVFMVLRNNASMDRAVSSKRGMQRAVVFSNSTRPKEYPTCPA